MKLGVYHVSNFIINNEKEYNNSIIYFQDKGFTVIRPVEEFKKFEIEIAIPFEFNKIIKRNPILALPSFCEKNTKHFLNRIDFKEISKTSTAFCGNSYVTPILNAISTKTNNSVYYGPNFISQFNLKNRDEIYIDLIQAITIQNQKKYFQSKDYLFYGSKEIKGILVGGEINSLIQFWDTNFSFKLNSNSILFIDGIINNIEELNRIINFLNDKKVFKKAKAIIFGETILENKIILDTLLKQYKNVNKANLVLGFAGMLSEKISIIRLNSEIKIDFKRQVIIQ